MFKIWLKRSACLAAFLLLSGIALVLHDTSVFPTFMPAGSSATVTACQKPVVYIDAGHGGIDPGKVGINNALEKDVNLSIVMKLKDFLEASDVEVVLTRDTDRGLYEENDSNKKVQDMKNRVKKIEETHPALVVSVHQNSYHEEHRFSIMKPVRKGNRPPKSYRISWFVPWILPITGLPKPTAATIC